MKRLTTTLLLLGLAAVARAESVAIIVAKECNLQELSTAELRAILHCDKVISPSKTKWLVALRPKASPEHAAILKHVYKTSADELESYFMMADFNGSINPVPKIVPSGVMLQHIVSGNVSCIGYVRASEVTDLVKVLKIDGALPSDSNYPIRIGD